MLEGTFGMLVKMSSITFVYVAVTFLLWKALADRKMGIGDKIALGFIQARRCGAVSLVAVCRTG